VGVDHHLAAIGRKTDAGRRRNGSKSGILRVMRVTVRLPILSCLGLLLALALAGPTAQAAPRADYTRVASAYATSGGHLDPCAFTRAQLERALKGIPKSIASVVPDLRKAIRDGIAAHERGDCKGRKPNPTAGAGGATGGVGAPPETTTSTTPTTPPPAATAPSTATTPAQPGAVPPTTTTPTTSAGQATRAGGHRDRTPLAIAAIAIGALLLALLALWALARARGWDSPRAARLRHAWGEAGYRTTGVWAEFADWLRLGR
jgi:hypothetical protein